MTTTLGASRATGRGRQSAVEEALDVVGLVDELPFDDDDGADEPDESLDDVEEALAESLDVLLLSFEEAEDSEPDRESVL
ncbi:hypothetical protein [Janibacter cremeus]|uniref:Uncharacterized protein n=1 Tax=Janibacter cremeus TaxID=1285192 RepID=A0A852VLA2_9MICO|nr:hypothetical protein [Janibacter cremeus]